MATNDSKFADPIFFTCTLEYAAVVDLRNIVMRDVAFDRLSSSACKSVYRLIPNSVESVLRMAELCRELNFV